MKNFESKLLTLNYYFTLKNNIESSLIENIVNPNTAAFFYKKYSICIETEVMKIIQENSHEIINCADDKLLIPYFLNVAEVISEMAKKHQCIDESLMLIYKNKKEADVEQLRKSNWKRHCMNLIIPNLKIAVIQYKQIFETENKILKILNDISVTEEEKELIIDLYIMGYN